MLIALLAMAATFIDLPGHPFAAIPSRDGKLIFVTMVNPPGIAVVKDGAIDHVIPMQGGATGAVLTHDGKQLIVANDAQVAFVDTATLKVTGYAEEEKSPSGRIGAVYVNVTKDDRTLFVSDEYAQRITVIDIAKRAVVGTIPTGPLPIALTFSPDEKYLYTTNESALPAWNWTPECKPENPNAPSQALRPPGAMLVIDVAKREVVAKAPAGCSAVRLALSPDGATAYVTARNADAVMVFDTASLKLKGKVAVGSAPVGVAVVDGGRKIVVTNSNRFAADADSRSTLSVIDAATLKVIGTVPAGGFPRELHLTPDGKTLLVTNFASKTLQLIDVATLPGPQAQGPAAR